MVVFTGSHTLHGHQKKMSGSMVILADRMGDGRTFAVALMCALVAGCMLECLGISSSALFGAEKVVLRC
jgi:hypothetical protein